MTMNTVADDIDTAMMTKSDNRFLRRCLLAVITALLLAIFSPAHGLEKKEDMEKKTNKFRIKIRRLQHGIIQEKDQFFKSKEEERGILSEIEALDKKLVEERTKLNKLNKQKQHQQSLIEREEQSLDKIRADKERVEKHLEKRITAYYTMGDIGILNVTFSTQTLPALLSFHDSFDSLLKYDQQVIETYKTTIHDLERANKALNLEKSVLEAFIEQGKEQEAQLEDTKAEKRSLLTYVRTQTKLHKQAIAEMEKASAKLEESIVAIKSKYNEQEREFLLKKGNLPPPVDGVIITRYNQKKTNKLGISRVSRGIELKAKDGTEVIAVSGGDVIYSGYLRGYGNTVIIHHGLQYYTVTSRIEKLLVDQGDRVSENDKIGVVGDTATLFDEGLYFEIRHGKDSLDPILWLNPNRLSAMHENKS